MTNQFLMNEDIEDRIKELRSSFEHQAGSRVLGSIHIFMLENGQINIGSALQKQYETRDNLDRVIESLIYWADIRSEMR